MLQGKLIFTRPRNALESSFDECENLKTPRQNRQSYFCGKILTGALSAYHSVKSVKCSTFCMQITFSYLKESCVKVHEIRSENTQALIIDVLVT